MNIVMDSFERANGFSILTADELFFVNGGSGTTVWDAIAGVGMLDVGLALIGGGTKVATSGGIAGAVVGAGLAVIGGVVVFVAADVIGGDGLDRTQAIGK
ncbi:MAG: hypothetical protein LBL45_11855 [Treponema sp.]|jgi:hypothetical protein|nr:hypothetical protein [Treponema sp.]